MTSAVSPKQIKHFVSLFNESEKCESELRNAPESATSDLSPWQFWTLVCFARHHVRQNWVADIVKFRLSGELEVLAAAGALGHPDIPQSGVVPKDPEWEYYFHGRGCCLTHRGTGEAVDVDFFDDTGNYFSLWFFQQYLKSLESPQFPERRLLELHPSVDTVEIAANELFSSNAFCKHPDRSVYKLSDQIVSCIPNIELFSTQIADHKKTLHRAITAGDWLLAQDANNRDDRLNAELEGSAQKLVETRLQKVQSLFEKTDRCRVALIAINEVAPNRIEPWIIKSLRQPSKNAVSCALELIHQSGDPKWCPFVFELFRRNDFKGFPAASSWHSAASFLLEHDFETKVVVGCFDEVQERASADFALLALQYCPSKSVALFFKALRSSIPMERIEASAMLAIIDQPWSREVLVTVLSESADHEVTLYPRAALLASKHVELHKIAEEWESAHPRKSETGEFISMGEWAVRQKDAQMTCEIQKLHDRVWPLRNAQIDRSDC